MQNLQDVFNKTRATKREQRQIKEMYKDALESSSEYRDILEKIRGYKLRKKQIEDQTKAELGSDYAKMEALKQEASAHKIMLTDIAINKLMAGESAMVEDDEKNPYEPVFSVRYKKTNSVTPHTP